MAKVRKQYPNLHFTEVAKKAKETYQKGGSALGGDLSPEAVHGLHGSGVDLDTQVATQHGGKKSRRSKSGKKSRSRKSKSSKSKSRKRH